MNNWLDKYKNGGGVLKQKTKDNYGKKPNPNDVDATFPPGFVGMGNNIKGRNYSPAWGGQFAMGGNLPGAVGFTYARTQGAAPSNGPYAKKTKASAQNGMEMKYYQEGLDFQPKTISRDGVEIAQYGKSVPKDILIKQAFRESGLDPEAVSPVGAVGLTQIMPITHKHYLNATKEKPGDLTDPEYSVKVQKWVMDDLYNRKALNNPNQSEEVKLAKVLAGYNWGMGNLTKALDKAKQNTDIYKSLDWMKMLPKETSTYINQILLNKDPGFEEEFQEAIKTSPYTKLYEQPEEANKFTSNVPTIFDLGKQPKSFQDGGEIAVDPEGYWNPENWGNPVIIPSTDITMEDVYEPLIGISNTGDMQYMEPGEDYEFDGEYVTEFPIAKKGISINQADAKPIEKLDQLLNFTNYNKPTKGGWLDKYQ